MSLKCCVYLSADEDEEGNDDNDEEEEDALDAPSAEDREALLENMAAVRSTLDKVC
jgi:hypothetical protein